MITDKELLAICNLSNLKMEFADIVKEKEIIPNPKEKGKFIEKIKRYHTIYSLLEKELNVIKIKEKYKNILAKQIPNGNLENLKEIHSNFGENMNSNTKELLLEQNSLRSEEIICRKELDKVKKDISFYNISKDNKQVPIYSCKEELQKEAPIVMEYYDRYSKVNKSDKVDKSEELKQILFSEKKL